MRRRPAFNGRSRLDRHRAVNALLADQLRNGVHALAIEAHGTEDPARRPETGR